MAHALFRPYKRGFSFPYDNVVSSGNVRQFVSTPYIFNIYRTVNERYRRSRVFVSVMFCINPPAPSIDEQLISSFSDTLKELENVDYYREIRPF